jgi:endothelin-converting enzyme/putative endopeptidase
MRNLIAIFLMLLSSSVMFGQQLHGIDVNDLDRSADPCNDFFQFANGTWRKNNPIPASMTRWSKRWQAGETAKDKLRDILEDAEKQTNAPKGSTEQLIGDYYGACMDTAKVNARGVEPIKPWFAEIDGAKNMATLQITVEKMHDMAISVPFTLSGTQDLHNPTMVIADIGQSALGLPERDYYLKPDQRFAEARDKYKEHIVTMFKLAGWDEKKSTAAAQTVLAMETKFAEASLGQAELRDPKAVDHKTSFAELQAMVPHFDWVEFYKHKRLPQETGLNIDQPKFMKEFDRQLAETPIGDWKVYYQWHLPVRSAGQ